MLLFNIVPTFVELFFVCAVLLSLYKIWFSVFTLITIIGYVSFTLVVTEVHPSDHVTLPTHTHAHSPLTL